MTYGHGEQALELTEGHLLTCLRGDGLHQESSSWSAVEVREETVNTRFTEFGELLGNGSGQFYYIKSAGAYFLAEVKESVHGRKRIIVRASLGTLACKFVSEMVMQDMKDPDLEVCWSALLHGKPLDQPYIR